MDNLMEVVVEVMGDLVEVEVVDMVEGREMLCFLMEQDQDQEPLLEGLQVDIGKMM